MDNRQWSCAILLALTGPLVAACESGGDRIDPQEQSGVYLLIDDHFVARQEHVTRTVHPAVKLQEPVVVPDRPWEDVRINIGGTVAYDGAGKWYEMWYLSHVRDATGKDPRLTRSQNDFVLYARSRDGVRWSKPALGIYKHGESDESNIVYDLHSPSVAVGLDEQGDRRFWMAGWSETTKTYVTATSDDGLRWAPGPQIATGGDNITLARDPASGRFMAFLRVTKRVGAHDRRAIAISSSDDFAAWSEPIAVLVPDEVDDAWITDPSRQHTHFYNMSVSPYQGMYLGLVTVCHFKPTEVESTAPHQSSDDGPAYVELVYSRDGTSWRRLPGRPAVLSPGPAAWDGGMILGASNLIDVGDETWVYYYGYNVTHGGTLPPKRSAIGRASWKRGRFVSLDTEPNATGVVETVPLNGHNNQRLYVNADATRGELTAELIDAHGNPIVGYGAADQTAFTGDSVDHAITWNGRDRIAVDGSTPIAIRFTLRRASLYSFRFGS